ncbi:2-phosphosulfolactate phosphatase [Sunxiuqinia dokdonensis]|uniref:Probable 2-phosphosulfolactate phosphatase n=1 Tax=Sunxiuqinia dokdonensis TaxID=1409788 RepID=A0A0L8VDJ4_9BACT|nr:2-phosphosulfolactate phosphatase [Sunxiuqinia dokdonensis]KOH46534.1 2-phosphosulfolactate phosphatase [Sunxiuqinia dokdonensis]
MMNTKKRRLEVCITPAIYDKHAHDENLVVVIDVLRATSSICTAFANGVDRIIPVATVEEARQKKEAGYIVASERDGYVLDFADFGNSPFNFSADKVKGKQIVYSTTNGTRCIHMASHSQEVLIGSFLNLSALAKYLIAQDAPVLLFCASWKDRFSLEDTVCAGALAELLLNSGQFESICDAVTASVDLWSLAKTNLNSYSLKTAQKGRLASKGLDDCMEFCHQLDFTNLIPYYTNGTLLAKSMGHSEK